MACRFEYKGKTYDQDGLAKELEKMLPSEAHQFIPGVQNLPNMPFKSSWPDLALKRIIRQAAENNMDSVSWTPGEAQAARYDLSKHIEKIHLIHFTEKGAKPELVAYDKRGQQVLSHKINDTKEIADYIGKEAAEKLLAQEKTKANEYNPPVQTLQNADLKIGGEGMKAFYDKILVDKANAIAKKFGGKVEQAGLKPPLLSNVGTIKPQDGGMWKIEWEDGTFSGGYGNRNNAEVALRLRAKKIEEQNNAPAQPIHVLRITPQLRDAAINKGFSLFADSGRVGAPLTALTKVEHNPFTTDAYHGAPKGFKGDAITTPEFFSTPNPNLAGGNATPLRGGYARSNRPASEATGNSVVPLKLDTREYTTYDAGGKTWQEVNNRAIWEAQQAGKKGVVVKNVVDSPDSANKTPQTINITLDGATVRSKFAKFDPEKFHESGLLKASGLPIITDKDGKQLDHNLKPLSFDEQNALLNRNPLPTHKATEPDKPINKTALALAASKAAEYAAWAARPSLGGPLFAASIVGNAAYNAAPIKQRREGQPLGRYKLVPIKTDPFKDDQ